MALRGAILAASILVPAGPALAARDCRIEVGVMPIGFAPMGPTVAATMELAAPGLPLGVGAAWLSSYALESYWIHSAGSPLAPPMWASAWGEYFLWKGRSSHLAGLAGANWAEGFLPTCPGCRPDYHAGALFGLTYEKRWDPLFIRVSPTVVIPFTYGSWTRGLTDSMIPPLEIGVTFWERLDLALRLSFEPVGMAVRF